MVTANNLHLESLEIESFRGIDKLTIPRLGRVTLLAGKNGVGKTTVLEALRVYAARGHYAVMADILKNCDEIIIALDNEDEEFVIPDWSALFHGRKVTKDACIAIGPIIGPKQGIRVVDTNSDRSVSPAPQYVLEVDFAGEQYQLPWSLPHTNEGRARYGNMVGPHLSRSSRHPWESSRHPAAVSCESLGPGAVSNANLVRLWDAVALTDDEDLALDALHLIYEGVKRVAVIGDEVAAARPGGRRPVVRLKDGPQPVPLKSLGEGAVRVFAVALALANAKDGFLLIDEVENGIHHTLQADFWRMILDTAQRCNVQVLATTHSWDCVRGFSRALDAVEGADGMLYRMSRAPSGLAAVEYTPDDLRVAADQLIEVR